MKDQTASIHIKVTLDKQQIPLSIHWVGEGQNEKEAKAFLLSIWDSESTDTYKIDLWTGEMKKDEMIQFFAQTIHSMADTLRRSTGCSKASAMLKDASKRIYEEGTKEMNDQSTNKSE